MNLSVTNAKMPHSGQTVSLLASPEPALLHALEPVLAQTGDRVEVVLSAPAALAAMTAPDPPRLALVDATLPGMPTSELLARAGASGRRYPILIVAETVTAEWLDRLAEGAMDDLLLRGDEVPYWKLRIDLAQRGFRLAREVEELREAATLSAQLDRLTGVYNREGLLSMLFRETDRVQRLHTPMTMLLFDIDDFGHWNSRLGAEACDQLLCQVVSRTTRLLRSYDLVGRPGMDAYLLALPGCGIAQAVLLAERLRLEVFSVPFQVAGESIRLSACFGIAASQGRSPVVVLREAEEALIRAKAAGPESIQCFDGCARPALAPVTYLSSTSGDELIAW
jgi:two-component system, cell cycle response regulator